MKYVIFIAMEFWYNIINQFNIIHLFTQNVKQQIETKIVIYKTRLRAKLHGLDTSLQTDV